MILSTDVVYYFFLFKVKVDADSDFTSLYALCRQWLKNDIPRKKQVNCMIEYPYILESFALN